ncbi:hypothetical protein BAE44_0005138 [Dichanthelium oligosanthes]|uniref:Uncharacterized protein n=1 Tax=Dichanthelium oligosanthes TaxID=888268 RepID=A0A1E5W935_9POAL|nr:hypothetical protein BAE44_0005138 [Dichanthelium oligosanthes]
MTPLIQPNASAPKRARSFFSIPAQRICFLPRWLSHPPPRRAGRPPYLFGGGDEAPAACAKPAAPAAEQRVAQPAPVAAMAVAPDGEMLKVIPVGVLGSQTNNFFQA